MIDWVMRDLDKRGFQCTSSRSFKARANVRKHYEQRIFGLCTLLIRAARLSREAGSVDVGSHTWGNLETTSTGTANSNPKEGDGFYAFTFHFNISGGDFSIVVRWPVESSTINRDWRVHTSASMIEVRRGWGKMMNSIPVSNLRLAEPT